MTPQELAAASQQLATVAGDLEQAASRHRGVANGMGTAVAGIPSAWTSPTATELHREASGFLGAIAGAPGALTGGSGALRTLGMAAGTLAEELRRHLEAAASASAAASAARSQLGAVPPDDVETRRHLLRRESDQLGVQRAAEAGVQDVASRWDAACRTCVGSLESAMQGLGVALLGPQAAAGASGGPAAASADAGEQLTAFLLGDIAAVWGGSEDVLPLGSGIAGMVRIVRMTGWVRAGGAPDAFPTFANGGIGRTLSQRVPGLGFLANPVTQRLLTGTTVVGGVYTGVTGTIDVVQHGNPVHAFNEHGAGYTADVSRTAFGFGTAGLGALALAGVAAPPVLVIVTVGAGVVWVGSEVIDHWDDITGFVGDRWDDVSGFVGDRWDDVSGFVGDRWQDASALAGDLRAGAGDVLGTVGDGIGGLASGARDAAADLPLVGGLFG
jgi:hypothetical protein